MKRLACLPLIAILAACQPAATEDVPPAEAPATASETGPWQVTAEAVGPLTGETPYDVATIQGLFPGATVEGQYLHFGDETTPIITVYGADELALEIQGDINGNVSQVRVQGGNFIAPNGATLLTPWSELGLSTTNCGMGEGRNYSCADPNVLNVYYVIAVPGWDSDEAPNEAALNAAGAMVGTISWIRP